jgi:hypothetical protein
MVAVRKHRECFRVFTPPSSQGVGEKLKPTVGLTRFFSKPPISAKTLGFLPQKNLPLQNPTKIISRFSTLHPSGKNRSDGSHFQTPWPGKLPPNPFERDYFALGLIATIHFTPVLAAASGSIFQKRETWLHIT